MGRRHGSEARVFAAGVLCGVLASAVPAYVLARRYAHVYTTRVEVQHEPMRPSAPSARPTVDWGDGLAAPTSPTRPVAPLPAATAGTTGGSPSYPDSGELSARHLEIPVEGVTPDRLVRSFSDARSGGRAHEALDILAPRNSVVRAADNGRIVKLFYSKAGGLTVYQFDPSERWCYYYAHLERYAPGLSEGQPVNQGDVIGYVGTSGNAPANTPHLHFAIFKLGPEKRWWEGTPIDPYDVLRQQN